jgi:hypothetical protein
VDRAGLRNEHECRRGDLEEFPHLGGLSTSQGSSEKTLYFENVFMDVHGDAAAMCEMTGASDDVTTTNGARMTWYGSRGA